MKVVYESDNGRRFETKEACLAYENRYKSFSFIICWGGDNIGFDCENGISNDVKKVIFKSVDEVGKAIYDYSIVFIPNKDVLSIIEKIGEEEEINTTCMEVGLNFWSDKECKWVQSTYYKEKLWESLQSLNNFENNVDDFVNSIIDY